MDRRTVPQVEGMANRQPPIWPAHRWGYLGCRDMDGPEGGPHPELGATIAGRLFGAACLPVAGPNVGQTTVGGCRQGYHSAERGRAVVGEACGGYRSAGWLVTRVHRPPRVRSIKVGDR